MPIDTHILESDTSRPPPRHQRLHGYLKLEAESDEDGRTRFIRKGFKSPIHISKPYWNGHSLLLNVMSPTAGLLQGDHIDIDIHTHSGASLTLSNPAALRIHKMETGSASLNQSYQVGAQSFIELNPEWLIPQAQSSFDQQTTIDVEVGGELLFIEAIAPGRVAYKETFEFKQFQNRLRLSYDKKLSALEHYDLRPENASSQPWQSSLKGAFYVSLFLVSEKLTAKSEIWKSIHELQSAELSIGSSQLAHGPCWNVKLLTANPIIARKAIEEIRRLYYQAIQRPISNLRRQ